MNGLAALMQMTEQLEKKRNNTYYWSVVKLNHLKNKPYVCCYVDFLKVAFFTKESIFQRLKFLKIYEGLTYYFFQDLLCNLRLVMLSHSGSPRVYHFIPFSQKLGRSPSSIIEKREVSSMIEIGSDNCS